MILSFTVEGIGQKEADDLAVDILMHIQDTHDFLVTDYRIEDA